MYSALSIVELMALMAESWEIMAIGYLLEIGADAVIVAESAASERSYA